MVLSILIWNSANLSTISLSSNLRRHYGGIFIVMALLWGLIFEGIVPDSFDLIGALIASVGVAIIYYAPRKGDEKL